MAQVPKIRLDAASGVPAVRQIADSLRVLFVEGRLVPGSTLPSVRRVAMELGVHFNTVAEAYRQLADEGWLKLRHGRSAVVMPRAVPAVTNRTWAEDFRLRLRSMAAQMRADGISPDRIAAELRAMAKVVTRS
jgi:DNA-binding transcriptional regulator YhcF (GntR family)